MFEGHHKKNVIVACFAVIDTHNYVKKDKLHSTMVFGHYNGIFHNLNIFKLF
jgi:hypothetical protein